MRNAISLLLFNRIEYKTTDTESKKVFSTDLNSSASAPTWPRSSGRRPSPSLTRTRRARSTTRSFALWWTERRNDEHQHHQEKRDQCNQAKNYHRLVLTLFWAFINRMTISFPAPNRFERERQRKKCISRGAKSFCNNTLEHDAEMSFLWEKVCCACKDDISRNSGNISSGKKIPT